MWYKIADQNNFFLKLGLPLGKLVFIWGRESTNCRDHLMNQTEQKENYMDIFLSLVQCDRVKKRNEEQFNVQLEITLKKELKKKVTTFL